MGKASRKKTKKSEKFYKNTQNKGEESPMSKELLYGVLFRSFCNFVARQFKPADPNQHQRSH